MSNAQGFHEESGGTESGGEGGGQTIPSHRNQRTLCSSLTWAMDSRTAASRWRRVAALGSQSTEELCTRIPAPHLQEVIEPQPPYNLLPPQKGACREAEGWELGGAQQCLWGAVQNWTVHRNPLGTWLKRKSWFIWGGAWGPAFLAGSHEMYTLPAMGHTSSDKEGPKESVWIKQKLINFKTLIRHKD